MHLSSDAEVLEYGARHDFVAQLVTPLGNGVNDTSTTIKTYEY